jgi:hypothetical protein
MPLCRIRCRKTMNSVDETLDVNRLEHRRILRRREGGGMDKPEASLLPDDLRHRCLVAAASYQLKTGQEPYRLVIEERGEVTVVTARKYFSLA